MASTSAKSLWFHNEEAKEVFAGGAGRGRRYNITVNLPDPIDGPLLERNCMMPFRFIFVDTDSTAALLLPGLGAAGRQPPRNQGLRRTVE